MNWRLWLYTKLSLLATVPPSSVFAAGRLVKSPSVRPFIVYRLQEESARLKDDGQALRTARRAEIWAYGNPGSFDLIDAILREVRIALVGPVLLPGGVACEWIGDGIELPADEYKALARVGSYNLIGAT